MSNFDFDMGGGGSDGPWISWSARGTLDGVIPPQSFYLRDQNGRTLFEGFKTGVVFDIEKMQTGWQRSDGVAGQAPDWRMNPSVSQFIPQPGDDYKRGFKIPCAIGGGQTATWEQAGAGAWNAFTSIVPAIRQGPNGRGTEGKLPVVRLTGTKAVQFKRGSTVEPILEVASWVDRPDCLKDGVAAGIDTGAAQSPAQAAQAAQAAQPAAAPPPPASAAAEAAIPAAGSF